MNKKVTNMDNKTLLRIAGNRDISFCKFFNGDFSPSKIDNRVCWYAERNYIINDVAKDDISWYKTIIPSDKRPKNLPDDFCAALLLECEHTLGGDYPPEQVVPRFIDIVSSIYSD